MSAPAPLAVSVTEAAKMLGISRSSFYTLLGEGKLRAVKVGARSVVIVAELEQFLRRCPNADVNSGGK